MSQVETVNRVNRRSFFKLGLGIAAAGTATMIFSDLTAPELSTEGKS